MEKPKYAYEEPVIKNGVVVKSTVKTYTEARILKEFWESWVYYKSKDGAMESELTHENCINDWVAYFDAKLIN